MDLSKAFNDLNHDVLLAKMEAYGLDNNVVSFMRSYLTIGLHRCKINNSFSKWVKISAGVPQGPLLFNIFINDIFLYFQKYDLASYANDSTKCTSDKRVSAIIGSLSHEFTILSK